jgi:pyruvate/2-oxoglutarate dehydrogenase complex dihydrolipoamide acyltransferase (E2) component
MSEVVEIKIEDAGDADDVEVISVSVSAGDSVTAGAVLMELATDKANVDIEAPSDGVVEALNVAEGDVIAVDAVLATLRVGS